MVNSIIFLFSSNCWTQTTLIFCLMTQAHLFSVSGVTYSFICTINVYGLTCHFKSKSSPWTIITTCVCLIFWMKFFYRLHAEKLFIIRKHILPYWTVLHCELNNSAHSTKLFWSTLIRPKIWLTTNNIK